MAPSRPVFLFWQSRDVGVKAPADDSKRRSAWLELVVDANAGHTASDVMSKAIECLA